MKRIMSAILAVLLLILGLPMSAESANAGQKDDVSRAIAIVFDNSGSMYLNNNQAWCRATYAMEVFASMLNKGDTLQIYPMWPITVGGQEYTMERPFTVTDASQSSVIRDIYSPKAEGTPIESIDAAVSGVSKLTADKKYVIVLTDGTEFYKNNNPLSPADSIKELDARIGQYAGADLSMMYLGIGQGAILPNTPNSQYFFKKKAGDSADVLSSLTVMCNQIFGRDTLPKKFISGNSMQFDISLSKLIVFVQGENVKDLTVTNSKGEPVGTLESSAQTMYGTAGTGRCTSVPDTSLQGMMVTYTGCGADTCNINYSGNATSIEVYYEPDADLAFIFTDADGNLVDADSLYEGEYKVSFGMKDAKTGQLISSELLGNTQYEGSYSINGQEHPFSSDKNSGEVPVTLKLDDKFEAELTVTYLSGYTITKDSSDFGWPEGGITVAPHPAGDLVLKISGGAGSYSLLELEAGKTFIAEVYYQDVKMTGPELEAVELWWDPNTSYAEIKKEFKDDHYELSLHYKDPNAPEKTTCGECKVPITATYTAPASDEASAKATITYTITDGFAPVMVELSAPQDYIVISELEKSKEIIAKLTLNGKPLTAEEFRAVTLQVDCGGIEYSLTPDPQNSSYRIKLLPTDKISEADYTIKAYTIYRDRLGREVKSEGSVDITLSHMPLWLKWLIGIGILLLLILIIWKILHTRVLPKHVRHKKDECYMSITGQNITEGTDFNAKLSGKQLSVKTQYNGNMAGINITNAKPGKESFLYKPQQKRGMIVRPENVKMFGDITYADINGVGFVLDKNEGKLVPEDPDQGPFMISNNANISFDGRTEENGRTKKIHAEVPLTFRKR